MGRGSVQLRARWWRERTAGDCSRASGPAAARRETQRRALRRRLAQGHDPAAPLVTPRIRPAEIPRSPGPESLLPEHPRLQRSRTPTPHAHQRHLALRLRCAGDAVTALVEDLEWEREVARV